MASSLLLICADLRKRVPLLQALGDERVDRIDPLVLVHAGVYITVTAAFLVYDVSSCLLSG
jgi:hypothetical protein